MIGNMSRYKLRDLLSIQNGKDYRNLNHGDIPVYGTGGIIAHVNAFLSDRESILLPRKGTLNNIMYVSGKFWTVDTMYWTKINEDLAYPKYLFYYLSLLDLSARDSGSTLPSMTFESYYTLDIDLPPLEKQKDIADRIFKINQNIENNHSIINNLESLTKTLYDYWFLQFEFPNEEGKPYKSSGGKMVWCEELKREIPEGWEVSKLCRVLDIFQNKIDIKSLENRKYIPIEVIPRHQMSFYETAPLSKASTGLCSFNEKTILLSNRRVYFHKVVISPYKGVTRDTVITILPTDKNNLGYVFQLIYSDHFIKYASLHSYGTEQPVLSPDAVYNYKFAYPTNGLDLQYSKNVEPLINYVLEKERENEKLSSLRDFLLPMLMNGQVTLKDN